MLRNSSTEMSETGKMPTNFGAMDCNSLPEGELRNTCLAAQAVAQGGGVVPQTKIVLDEIPSEEELRKLAFKRNFFLRKFNPITVKL